MWRQEQSQLCDEIITEADCRMDTDSDTCVCLCVCTWGKADIRNGVTPMVEAQQVLQRVCVHHQDAAVAQTDRQRFPVRREGAAATACNTHQVSDYW